MFKFFARLSHRFFGREQKIPVRVQAPRIRVKDCELNRVGENSSHWKELIGHEGIYLSRIIDAEGEAWDVKLDSQPIPHSMVNRERFELLTDVSGTPFEHLRRDV